MPDLADEIFSAPIVADTTGGQPDGSGQPAAQDESTPQGEGESQGKDQPGTPDEKVTEDKDKTEDVTKEKKEGAAEARKWGEKWKETAEQHEKRIKEEYEPLLTKIDEKFGGEANLELAAEIYGAINVDPESFDPAKAIEFLGETAPHVAAGLVNHIAAEVIGVARAQAISDTFGRELSKDEITQVNAFLASGKKEGQDYTKFFKDDANVPEHLLTDEHGNPLPKEVVDFMRAQAQQVNATNNKINNLEKQYTQDKQQSQTAAAQGQVDAYVGKAMAPISTHITELGLDQAYEGETPENASQREQMAQSVHFIALGLAGQDKQFQEMYKKALGFAAQSGNKLAQASAVDYSRRINHKMASFAKEAAGILSPVIDTLASTKKAQVDKTKQTRTELSNTPGSPTNDTPKKEDFGDDPFNTDSIMAAYNDRVRKHR